LKGISILKEIIKKGRGLYETAAKRFTGATPMHLTKKLGFLEGDFFVSF